MTADEATALLERYDIPELVWLRGDWVLVVDTRLEKRAAEAGINARTLIAHAEDAIRDDDTIDWGAVAAAMAQEREAQP